MKKYIYLIIFLFSLNACQATKDALTLKKKPSGDEFLVEKKSPLVLPPNFGKLPLPSDENIIGETDESTKTNITLGNEEIKVDVPIKNSKPSSLEKSILEKIK